MLNIGGVGRVLGRGSRAERFGPERASLFPFLPALYRALPSVAEIFVGNNASFIENSGIMFTTSLLIQL